MSAQRIRALLDDLLPSSTLLLAPHPGVLTTADAVCTFSTGLASVLRARQPRIEGSWGSTHGPSLFRPRERGAAVRGTAGPSWARLLTAHPRPSPESPGDGPAVPCAPTACSARV